MATARTGDGAAVALEPATPGDRRPVAATLRAALAPRRSLPTLTAGVVLGAVEVVFATSMAALVFSGPLAVHLPRGIGLTLMGAAAVMAITSLGSSRAGLVGSVQDSTAVILTAVVGTAVAGQADGAGLFATAVLAVVMSTTAVGVVFFLLGRFRLGHLIRYLPYPVIGGFLAGAGWLLVMGGLSILTERSVSLASLPEVLGSDVSRWGPGLAFGIVLLGLTRRFSHPMLIPGAVVGAVAAFYAGVSLLGSSLAEAEAAGHLLGPFPDAGLWVQGAVTALTDGSWSAVATVVPTTATVVVVAVLGLLLTVSAAEITLERDFDLDRELRVAGAGNLAAALVGGMPGYHALSFSMLSRKLGAEGRFVGVVGAAVCAGTAVLGTSLLSKIPRAIVAGLLIFLGISFLVDWLHDAARKMPRAEYGVIVTILAVIMVSGPLVGVAVGLVVAVGLFSVRYSRTGVVRQAFTASSFRSNVERDPATEAALRRLGERVPILQLQGFVFFGTATSLLEHVREALAPGTTRPTFLVLDFRRVTGLDSSAVMSFQRIGSLARQHGASLVLTGTSAEVRHRLEVGGALDETMRVLEDLDHGVEWCEEELLRGDGTGLVDHDGPDPFRPFLRVEEDRDRLVAYLTRHRIAAGHRLIRQGEESDEIFFLERGRLSARVERDGAPTVRLKAMGPGAVVGEVPLYARTPRSASVVADTDCIVLELRRSELSRMERQDPDLAAALHRGFATVLASRLADSMRVLDSVLD